MKYFNPGSWMWEEALSALELAERRQRRFFALLGARGAECVWEPPADVFESDSGLSIVVALPGVPLERIALSLEGPELVIQAERLPQTGIESMRIRRLEIPYGSFERRIALPPGAYTLRERRLRDGCLELYLAKE